MSLSFGGSSGNSNQQQQLNPELLGDWRTLFGNANHEFNRPGVAYGGELAPGLSSGQTAAANMIYNVANNGVGQAPVASAIDQAGRATGYFTPQVSTPSIGKAQLASAANIDPNLIPKVQAQTGASGMGAYLNPYEPDVVQSTLGDIERQRQQAIVGNSSNATLQGGEGAWNGARAGVSDSLTNEAALRAAASAAGSLRSQGFDTAANNAQADASRGLTAAQVNQGVVANVLGQNASFAQQAGLSNAEAQNLRAQQQAALQASIDQGNQQAGIQQAQTAQSGASVLGSLGSTQQSMALNADNALLNVGGVEQSTQTAKDMAAYQEFLRMQGIPEERLKEMAIPFGFYPTTASGGTTTSHSSGKSAQGGW